MNTSSITLIPATIIGVRISLSSQEPQAIIGTTIFASVCATVVAIIASKVLQKLPLFKESEKPFEPPASVEKIEVKK
jgi:spore maturation protein A